jgi:copper homeostasis protein
MKVFDTAPPQLEICAESAQAGSAAHAGGAHRIEICTALDVGGLTPSHGLIRSVIAAANGLPVYVLLRPRAGDFVYSNAEFRMICADMEHAAALGAAGFVTGILTAEGSVDQLRMRELITLAGPKEVTFHRAFDHARNLPQALEQIIEIGCDRLLTSGGKPTVREGMTAIVNLTHQAANRIRIAAGGGVTPAIATELRRAVNVDLHASLRRTTGSRSSSGRDPLWDGKSVRAEISTADVQRLASTLSVTPGRTGLVDFSP